MKKTIDIINRDNGESLMQLEVFPYREVQYLTVIESKKFMRKVKGALPWHRDFYFSPVEINHVLRIKIERW